MKTGFLFAGVLLFSLLLTGCSPVYVKNFKYESFVRSGDLGKAAHFLDDNNFFSKSRNRLLYCMEKGKILHLQEQYAASNALLNEADQLIEDLRMDVGSEALSLLTNDQMRPYRPEEFETVAVHYYKALNYMALQQPAEALVEARRINLALNRLDDKYADHKNKYQDDALAHILMGAIYESTGDYNNAFIAFRNAYDLFDEKKGSYLGAELPGDLILDLIHTAQRAGFQNEAAFYERKHPNAVRERGDNPGGNLYLFWENGLGPVKSEWSVNFTILPLGENRYAFVNNDLNLSFPFEYDGKKKKKKKEEAGKEKEDDGIDIEDIQFLRVAFPRYVSRPYQSYSAVNLSVNRRRYNLSLVEDYEVIARKSLEDRFFREAAKGLLRLATKKITEMQLRKENETAGALLGVVNALSEKADTRNWQTLPSSVSYAKIPLRKGRNLISMELQTPFGTETKSFEIEGTGKTQFRSIHTFSPLRNIKPTRYYSEMEREKNPFYDR